MATTKLYLDLRAKAQDGKGSIVILLRNGTTSTSFNTGIRLKKSEWKNNRVANRVDADILNVQIAQKKNEIDRDIALLSVTQNLDNLTAAEIKAIISQKNQSIVKTEKHLIKAVFAEYMDSEMSDNTRILYNSTLKKVIAYSGEHFYIEDLDYRWLLGFEKYLAKTQSVNGRAIYLRDLRTICNYAKATDIISKYPFENFTVKQEPTQKRCIDINTLREFMTYPAAPHLSVYRDYFFLMFFLIGINAKDLFLARHSNINNGRLDYIRSKTKKKYSIKIEPEAQALLDRYAGKNYLVEVMDRCKSYVNYMHEMDNALKKIGPEITEEIPNPEDLFGEPMIIKTVKPIIPDITTYFSRHTWATLAYEIGIPIDVISQALGHSMGNRTTLIYIKPDQDKVDLANRRVIDYLFGNGGTEQHHLATLPNYEPQ